MRRRRDSVSVAFAGSGGAGVVTAGNLLLEAAARAGYYALMTRTSGPQIRGGESAAALRVATFPCESPDDRVQLLVALDWNNVQRFAAELPLGPESIVVHDPAQGAIPEVFGASGARIVPLPMKEIAKSVPGGWPNMVAFGAAAQLLGLPQAVLDAALAAVMQKGDAARTASLAAARAGAEVAAGVALDWALAPAAAPAERWLITGNQAAGLGALRGGVRFVAAYPITPATELLEWMAPALDAVGGILVQAEDELASINMVLGASFGGVPALTATSGPGLSLMVESLGLGVAAELPVVVIDVMRTGPSTGIATKSEQADLNLALYGVHGDAPHLVLAPNSVADCLYTTQWAVALAERLQVPAIVLSDQFLGQARAVVDRPADLAFASERLLATAHEPGYRRYALTPSGLSPMALPGTPGLAYVAEGLAHTERGTPSSAAADQLAQLDKRARKLARADFGAHWASVEGEDTELAVITWGSTTGAVREACRRAAADGLALRLISLRLLSPPQPERLAAALGRARRALVVEQSHSGQLLRYLRAEYALAAELKSLRKPGPNPFRPEEVHRALVEWGRA